MTNTQIYFAFGVPIIALMFAMANSFALMSCIGRRIYGVDKRIDGVDKRFAGVAVRFDKRIEDMRDLLRAEMQRNHSEGHGQVFRT